jgi:hypothetical protein
MCCNTSTIRSSATISSRSSSATAGRSRGVTRDALLHNTLSCVSGNPPFLVRSCSDQVWQWVFGDKLSASSSVALSGEDRRPPYQEDLCWIVLHANWPLAAAVGASHRAAEAAASSSHSVALRLPISPHFGARPVAAKGFSHRQRPEHHGGQLRRGRCGVFSLPGWRADTGFARMVNRGRRDR